MDRSAKSGLLSPREREIAEAYANDASHRQIAGNLFIAPTTVRTHLRAIYRKLGVSSKLGLHRALYEDERSPEWRSEDPGLDDTAVTDPDGADAPRPSVPAAVAWRRNAPENSWPSIAVLSFDDMSDDVEMRHFGDGIAEEIITALAKIARLRVIARNSTFVYKSQTQDVRSIARALAVRYVLVGSVRRSGERLRVTAQLIDVEDGGRHLWAERYDRAMDDLFDIQDGITKETVTALRVQLTDGEDAAVWSRGTDHVGAWQRAARASELFMRFNVVDYLESRRLAEEAIALDPNYAHAHAVVGFTWWWDARLGFTSSSDEKFARADRAAAKAVMLDDTVPWATGLRSLAHGALGRYTDAVASAEANVARHPGNADVRGFLAFTLMLATRHREAVEQFGVAMETNPYPPIWYRSGLAKSLAALEQDAEALALCEGMLAESPGFFESDILIAAIEARRGRDAEARAAVARLRRKVPDLRAGHLRRLQLLHDKTLIAATEAIFVRLGLPE